jgi:hypothetical protein
MGVAGGLVIFLLAAVLLLNGGFAAREVKARLAQATGLSLEAKGGAHISFSPFAARLDDVVVSAPGGATLMTAQSLTIPLSFRELISRHAAARTATLEEPKFTFTVDAAGRSNWALESDALDRALSSQGLDGEALRLQILNGSIAYLDQSRSESFSAQTMNIEAIASRQGALELSGSASLGNRFANIHGQIDSLARLSEDGSPVSFSLAAPALSAEVSGRLLARGSPELAGTVRLASGNLADALKWTKLGLPALAKTFVVDGSIETKGATIRFPAANVTLDSLSLAGKATLDAIPAKPAASIEMPGSSFASGTGSMRFTLSAEGGEAIIDVKQADLGKLGVQGSLTGRADIRADMTGKGAGVAEMMSSLAGTGQIANGSGTIGTTGQFQSLTASFDIRNGMADTRDMKMKFNGNPFAGGGSISLMARTLDMSLTRPKAGGKAETLDIKGPFRALTRND